MRSLASSAGNRRPRSVAVGLIAPAAVAGASVAASAIASGSPAQAAAAPDPAGQRYASVGTVRRAVEDLAARNGDAVLEELTMFRTDRAHACEAVNALRLDDRAGLAPVTVIYARGAFVAGAAKLPPGARVPSGKVLVVVVDSAGVITDWGVHQRMPSVTLTAFLGPAIVVAAPPRGLAGD